MFTCSRLVDKACQNDDMQPPGMVLQEAVQLARSDPANIKRLVGSAVKKLASNMVIVRLKALRFLQHLSQNGPAAVTAEIKLNTTPISDCISWRGAPHPTRGWEPYQEMKDCAQSLLDLAFSAQGPSVQSFAVTNTGATGAMRVGGTYSNMESFGSGEVYTQAPSLDPRNLDPNHRDLGEEVKGFFKKVFKVGGPERPVASKYGSASNVPGASQMATGYSTYQSQAGYPPTGSMGGAGPAYGGYPQPEQYQEPPAFAAPPPPKRGQFSRLEADINWAKKKPANPIAERPKVESNTPAAKLLKVTGNRPIPTNGELNAFKAALTPDCLMELRAGLANNDWKVKVRAIAGLECYGQKFGFGTVADNKQAVEALKAAPQASLRGAANRFYDEIKDVEPEAPPEQPSAFDFGGGDGQEAEQPAADGEQEFTFGAAEGEAPAEEAEPETPAE